MGQVVVVIAGLFAIRVAISMASGLAIWKLMAAGKHHLLHVVLPAFIFIGLWLSFLVGVSFHKWYLPNYGFGVTPAEANVGGFVSAIGVPEVAEDVDYRVCPAAGALVVLEFQIEEKDFLAWLASKGWEAHRFVREGDRNVWQDSESTLPKFAPKDLPVTVTPVRSYLDGTYQEVEVKEGYYSDNYDPEDDYDDSGDTVVYDLETGRTYLRRTTY